MVLTILAADHVPRRTGHRLSGGHARYENTQQTLLNIQNAVTGPVSQANADSTALASGFIADVGRPPLAVANASNDPSQYLTELYLNPLGLPAYASYGPAVLTQTLTTQLTAANVLAPAGAAPPAGQVPLPPVNTATPPVMTAQLQVMSGWRGPYLRVPPQATNQLLDGWGNPYTLLQADMLTPVVPFQPGQAAAIAPANLVSFVQSPGGPAAPYMAPLTTQSSFTSSTATVTGAVANPAPLSPPSNPVYVLLFYPDMTQTPPVNVAWAIATSARGRRHHLRRRRQRCRRRHGRGRLHLHVHRRPCRSQGNSGVSGTDRRNQSGRVVHPRADERLDCTDKLELSMIHGASLTCA